MYMADCGIQTDPHGHVSPEEFVRYRRFAETHGLPLLPELYRMERVGMQILPSAQAQWSLVKTLIKEVVAHRTQSHGMNPPIGRLGSHDHTDGECLLPNPNTNSLTPFSPCAGLQSASISTRSCLCCTTPAYLSARPR